MTWSKLKTTNSPYDRLKLLGEVNIYQSVPDDPPITQITQIIQTVQGRYAITLEDRRDVSTARRREMFNSTSLICSV